jgi:hypothetical protein
MELATAGVPHELVSVELGGTNLQSTAGAVPKLVYGLAVSVPPEMLAVSPAPELVVWFQVVTKVNTVEPALTAPVTRIKSPVYGLTVEFNWNSVVAAAPGVSEYQPVVVKFGDGVPEPPTLVKPV